MGAEAGRDPVPRASIPLNPVFGWSVGNWMEHFFDGLKERRILGSRCPVCGRVFLPPRMVCERCFVKADEWVELPATGTVEACTEASVEVSEAGEMVDLEAPVAIAMVKHDGADTCVAARLEGASVPVGTRVEAVLDPEAEKAIDILAAYRPVG